MKKNIIIVGIAIAALIMCSQLGVLQALLLFFLVGAIPGTAFAVPSSVMLFLILITAWLVIFRFTTLKTFEKRTLTRLTRAYAERKSHLPKHRFGQV